ncbi:hypothetical protein B0O80DRAFT_533138 [Mortierella sp. GBAus27b]|nr:hypothetical protein BGX31_009147 [Mortierella sp. GBA43]KAI8347095.1 hypothetical protein B0O80DRAFT_533138 [Mortierella sp. GBAus27b]
MPSTGQDIGSQALPYDEAEVEYQDHCDSDHPHAAPSSTGSSPSSFYSFISFRNSTPSLQPNTPPQPRSIKQQAADATAILSTFRFPTKSPKKQQLIQLKEQGHDGSFDDHSFTEYEYETSIKPFRKPFYRRRRFWWICAVSTILFLAVFVPVFLIVILPKVAQVMINASTMEILQMNMTNPQEKSVQVSVDAAIVGIPSMFAATVDFHAPVQVFWTRGPGDQPRVGQMTLGTIQKKAFSKARFTQQTTFEIADPQLFGEFAKVMMASDTFLWRITATIDVSVLGRSIKDLGLDKALNLNGLSNFSNLKILSFDIPSDAPNGAGALVSIQVSIPNPSPIGMSLGTLDIDMQLENAKLGRITAKNAMLVGGQPTILQFDGVINKQNDPIALQELSGMISNYLANSPTTAYGQGVSVLPDGVKSVSWITTAIVSTRMSIPLLPPTPLNVIKQVNIKDMNLVMNAQQPWAPMVASTGIAALFQLPFKLSLNITDIWDPRLTLGYQSSPIAEISTAVWNRTLSDMSRNDISFTLPPSQMSIQPESHDTFEKFLVAVTQQDSAPFDIIGRAQSVALTSIGQVNITVPFNVSLTLQGINFAKMVPVISSITVASATVDYVVLNATVLITNPSIFTVEAGPATLHIMATTQGMTENIGDVIIPNLKLSPGPNPIQAFVHFQTKNPTFRNAFFSEYIAGNDFEATIYGSPDSSSIVSLAPIMEKFRMTTTIPGMKPIPKLVVGGRGNTTVGQFLSEHLIMLQVDILNPLATTFWVQELSANVSWRGYPFGNIQLAQTFSIKPSGVDTSPVFGIRIPTSYQFWMFLVSTFLPQNPGIIAGATVVVDLAADILINIDGSKGVGYESWIKYTQSQIGVFLKVEISLAGLGIGMPSRRKRSFDSTQDEGYRILDELGPEPDKEDWDAYLGWLRRAVQLAYPEEAEKERSK